jgi:hypothetical protein
MDNIVIYFNEITEPMDIKYFISYGIENNENLENNDLSKFDLSKFDLSKFDLSKFDYLNLPMIFLFGVFSSLCFYTFCKSTNKTPKYIYVEQEPIDNKNFSI